MKAYELLEDMKLQKQVDTLKERLARLEIAEAKARMENERLVEAITEAGCSMAYGESGDAYKYLYNAIGDGDYDYFEKINEKEEVKFKLNQGLI